LERLSALTMTSVLDLRDVGLNGSAVESRKVLRGVEEFSLWWSLKKREEERQLERNGKR